jgi:DUF4097 and DUF4098 domain-containing protein YvlB
MNRGIHGFAVCALALMLTGCDDWGDWGSMSRHKEEFRFTETVKPGTRLSVETMNGSVEIVAGEGDQVDIRGTKFASTLELLRALKIDVVNTGDTLRIRTIPPSAHRGNMGARYILQVPRRMEIDRIISSNGGITVDGVESASRLRTSNGSVRVNRTKGAIEVETSNASVELTGNDGPANVRTSNGHIRADDVRGAFTAVTSNASVTARVTNPEPGRPISVTTSNGNVNITVDSLKDNPVSATTSNSSIVVRLPAKTGVQLKATTSNASISTDFEVATQGTLSKNRIEGAINGSIRLERL